MQASRFAPWSSVKRTVTRRVTLTKLADMYLYYYSDDHALEHALTDPRTTIVRGDALDNLWRFGDVPFEDAWDAVGMPPFSLASLHYWNYGIDFSYVDVGANVGITAIGMAIFYKRCGKANKLFAFEPGDVHSLLDENIRINRLSDTVSAIKAAVSDQSGSVRFYDVGQSVVSSMIPAAVSREGIAGKPNPIIARAVTLDDFCKTIPATTGMLIKIDAEGADFKVLSGAFATLRTRQCCFQIEYFPGILESYEDPVARVKELLSDYYVLDVSAFNGEELSDDTLQEHMERVKGAVMSASDLMMIPKSLPGADILVDRIKNNK